MRLPFLVFCLVLATQAMAASRLPLIVLEDSALSGKRPEVPLVTIGSLPEKSLHAMRDNPQTFTFGEQPRWDTFPDNSHDTIDAIGDGKIDFAGPIARRTVVLLAAPLLNIRSSWMPDAITIKDKVITLEVTAWDGDASGNTRKNFDRRTAYLLSLTALPPGDYTFFLHCTHLAEQPDHRYLPADAEDASTPFTIAAADGKVSAPATIAESALKRSEVATTQPLATRMPPRHWARNHSLATSTDPAFAVGTLDAYKMMEDYRETAVLAPPRLQVNPTAEYASENFVALINPRIESGDFIRLRDVEFRGQDIVINAEYWQDMAPRAAVVPQSPFLLIPFYFVPKGRHNITLQWHAYQGTLMLSPTAYEEFPAEGQFKAVTMGFTIK